METLKIKTRDKKTNLDFLRKNGEIPGVFYGKTEKSTPISVLSKDFIKAWKIAGESSVVEIKMSDGTSLEALIYNVDIDPVTENPRHVDFYVFEKGQKIEIDIPLNFVGVAPGVKDFGGVLVKSRHEIEIEAIPRNLPHQIDIDISILDSIGSQINASEITLPEGVTLIGDPDETIISIAESQEEEEEVSEEVDMSSIEVEKKGKDKDSEDETAGGESEKVEKKEE